MNIFLLNLTSCFDKIIYLSNLTFIFSSGSEGVVRSRVRSYNAWTDRRRYNRTTLQSGGVEKRG